MYYSLKDAMGYSGKLTEKILAQKLRSQGFSYSEIREQIGVTKNSISRWCRDIVLTTEQRQRLLANKQLGQHKGSLIAAQNKRNKRNQTNLDYNLKAIDELGHISARDTFMAGIALYVAEGDKSSDGKSAFTNADPNLIKFMMNWFVKELRIPLSKFRGAIWIHDDQDPERAKSFWSTLTEIPPDQFHKTYIAKNKVHSSKVRKKIHQYGIFSIRFSGTHEHRKIMGWISALFPGKI